MTPPMVLDFSLSATWCRCRIEYIRGAALIRPVLNRNPGFGKHWLTVKLVGRESNRCAIGARIRVVFIEEGGERSI